MLRVVCLLSVLVTAGQANLYRVTLLENPAMGSQIGLGNTLGLGLSQSKLYSNLREMQKKRLENIRDMQEKQMSDMVEMRQQMISDQNSAMQQRLSDLGSRNFPNFNLFGNWF